MNIFKEKRSNLQKFISEQIIGPGAYNKRYFFLNDLEEAGHEFHGKKIKDQDALKNLSEIIPEVPAYQYSSGILFPETRFQVNNDRINLENEEDDDDINSDDLGNENTSIDDDETIDSSEEVLVNKQQNYPNLMGLSFVVDKNTILSRDLELDLNFRVYRKIPNSDFFDNRLSIWIPEYTKEIQDCINKYFDPILKIESKIDSHFVFANQKIEMEDIYDLDYINLNNYANEIFLPILKKAYPSIEKLEEKNGSSYFGIKREDYDLQFYSIQDREYRGKTYENVVRIFEASLNDNLKTSLEDSTENYSKFKQVVNGLEVYQQLKVLVTDLKSFYKKRNPLPVWKSIPYSKKIELPKPDLSKKIDRKEEFPVDINDSNLNRLNIKVQYILKDDLVYIKVLVINRFSILLDPNKPSQLNKKNDANLNSFFGVNLKVHELKNNILKPYNPPQLLDIDEEDNFNKLLYRKYLDYGEGYNTSVNWGQKEGRVFIATDFLPEQETPKVDYVPSKIENGKVVSRLKSSTVLSMRYLSTLSNASNADIFELLNEFVNEYKSWINEKSNLLSIDNSLRDDQKTLLISQLKSCQRDFRRLKRNISLLEDSDEGIAAFRLMNTAMFMQLHHSILKKKKPIDENLTELDYKKINLENEYKWRSFQLAFILLNIDGFIRPNSSDKTVEDVFETGWPERNELADLVWFPTGGGKTEAYLGIIAFTIALRRFKNKSKGAGTTVLMRYTLRLLTLQQFQRATLLICALEAIRKSNFTIPNQFSLGEERITIGLFVGGDSLPNKWNNTGNENQKTMFGELVKIIEALKDNREIKTNLPFKECPWCGENLFKSAELENFFPKPDIQGNPQKPLYGSKNADELTITCNNNGCIFHSNFPKPGSGLPLRLFDEDIYKFPPTLLFGTVDKFAALANKISTSKTGKNIDSRRLVGKGIDGDKLPPELIIQDELHLLLGPLGTAVGLYEKGIDYLCTYYNGDNQMIKPKIITSTATTRNTDKQIFALFNRRSEIFPKQGINADDSFFAYYERKDENSYISNRKYVGVLPVGKTQVWMQLRIASINLAHRLHEFRNRFSLDDIFKNNLIEGEVKKMLDYYYTTLIYFNSLKDVGKTQSQMTHYLPGDLNYIIKNTSPWSFIDRIIRTEGKINYSELTGRLKGEEVTTNLQKIELPWSLIKGKKLNNQTPPELVISTNMISVGIDVSRFNTMIISSMPRNIAEYIQASSRVARDREGIVFTVHHPFRSRDISHYQKFKEFHEKFYSYVEPISVTPFASKALDRYLAMLMAILIRHNQSWSLMNNEDADNFSSANKVEIKNTIMAEINKINLNASKLEDFLENKDYGVRTSVEGIIGNDDKEEIEQKIESLLNKWEKRLAELSNCNPKVDLVFNNHDHNDNTLFTNIKDDNLNDHWKVSHSLREIAPSIVIKTVQQ